MMGLIWAFLNAKGPRKQLMGLTFIEYDRAMTWSPPRRPLDDQNPLLIITLIIVISANGRV